MTNYEYRSAVSGLWYSNPKAAGDIDAMREAGVPCSDWRIAPQDDGDAEVDRLLGELAVLQTQYDEAVAEMRKIAVTFGTERIAAERRRQMDVKGWTPEHDDEHKFAALAIAARSYLRTAFALTLCDSSERDNAMAISTAWPFEESAWKPSRDPIRNLEKAGALVAAEIDRLHRQRDVEE